MRQYPVVVLKNNIFQELKIMLIRTMTNEIDYWYEVDYNNKTYKLKSLSQDLTKKMCCAFRDLYIEIQEDLYL